MDKSNGASTSQAATSQKRRRKSASEAASDEEDPGHAGTGFFDPPPRKAASGAFAKLLRAAQPHARDYKDVTETLPDVLKDERPAIAEAWRRQHDTWHAELRAGFSLMFYGVGSKRRHIKAFIEAKLTDGGVVEVNAWRSAVTAKRIVAAVLSALTGEADDKLRVTNVDALLKRIHATTGRQPVYLAVHSLDAPGLRTAEEQALLARLATAPCVRMLASVEHVNAAALFDAKQAADFQWLWHHMPTFEPLRLETLGYESVLAGAAAAETQASAGVVLAMLTQASRSVFKTLAEALLADLLGEDDEVEGLSYEHLFRLCRERFLVSSDATLRTHLTEFRDHGLIKSRKGPDGVELMAVPLPVAELRQLVEELDAAASAR